jgi:hypothetical protein
MRDAKLPNLIDLNEYQFLIIVYVSFTPYRFTYRSEATFHYRQFLSRLTFILYNLKNYFNNFFSNLGDFTILILTYGFLEAVYIGILSKYQPTNKRDKCWRNRGDFIRCLNFFKKTIYKRLLSCYNIVIMGEYFFKKKLKSGDFKLYNIIGYNEIGTISLRVLAHVVDSQC